jgi:hypothetical protein
VCTDPHAICILDLLTDTLETCLCKNEPTGLPIIYAHRFPLSCDDLDHGMDARGFRTFCKRCKLGIYILLKYYVSLNFEGNNIYAHYLVLHLGI